MKQVLHVYTTTCATIRNPGGGNFQESRISERGLVRAFFADACVSFQLVNIRESASIAFTFAARPRSAVEKYRWIRYPVGQVPVAHYLRSSSDPFVCLCSRSFQVYQEGVSCSNWRWSPIETAFTQSMSARTTTNFVQYFFFFFVSQKCNNKRRPRSRDTRWMGSFGFIGDVVYIGAVSILLFMQNVNLYFDFIFVFTFIKVCSIANTKKAASAIFYSWYSSYFILKNRSWKFFIIFCW